MFLVNHRLETNPFADQAVRPLFDSYSARQVKARLDELLKGNLLFLFISGPPGVGKSTLVSRRLDGKGHGEVSWLRTGLETREALLEQLMDDLGPGRVEASADEMRKILDVYLQHQAAKGQHAVIVADGLQRLSVPVLRELESLAQTRYKSRPLVHLVMITRNDELVRSILPPDTGARYLRATHERLLPFTIDETNSYLRACLQGAGCDYPEELLTPEVVTDIQAFTRGVVSDINALCREALDRVSESASSNSRTTRVTRALLKQAGEQLQLRYDPTAWEHAEGALTIDAVQLSEPTIVSRQTASLHVFSGGRVITEIALNRPRMVLGRDHSCDISLESSYVSRFQNLFMELEDGWILIDLNSTNGCFVNGRRVREHRLHDGDLIAVGQHQLRFVSTAARDQPFLGGVTTSDDTAADTLISPKTEVGRRA